MILRRALPISLALVALACAGPLPAAKAGNAAAKAGNAAAGKQKAAACGACHGADGNKTLDDSYPRIAGQYPDYLRKSLLEYKSGKRKNTVMQGQVQALSEQDIADLSAYYGSLDGELHDLSEHAR